MRHAPDHPLFILAFAASFGAGTAESEPMIESIDPSIVRVETGGFWQHAGQRGHYRVLVRTLCSSEHCHDSLFVQWIAAVDSTESERNADAGHRVAATTYAHETGDLTHFSDVHFVFAGGMARLEVRSFVEGDPKLHWLRCFTLGADGTYASREAPCPRPKRRAAP